jgi:hypothetical protein
MSSVKQILIGRGIPKKKGAGHVASDALSPEIWRFDQVAYGNATQTLTPSLMYDCEEFTAVVIVAMPLMVSGTVPSGATVTTPPARAASVPKRVTMTPAPIVAGGSVAVKAPPVESTLVTPAPVTTPSSVRVERTPEAVPSLMPRWKNLSSLIVLSS